MRLKNKGIKFSLVILCYVFLFVCEAYAHRDIYISSTGSLLGDGTMDNPVLTLDEALRVAKSSAEKDVNIYFRTGVYEFPNPVIITSDDFVGKRLLISGYKDENVILSGSKKLSLKWQKAQKGLYKAFVADTFDQMYINGNKRILARYPNYKEGELFNGTSEDALSVSRIKKWKDPSGGFIHSMHQGRWGSQHYQIMGKVKEELVYEGGYQLIRESPLHKSLRYVENIREELDEAGEWYLDKKESTLYYYPFPGEDLSSAKVEVVTSPHLIELRGEYPNNKLIGVTIRNLCFTRTLRTFMYPYESLMRSDWGIYRGGAVFLENTEDCVIIGCEFYDLGGNAVFLSRYNYNSKVIANHIHHIGASGICLVGDTAALRSPSFGYYDYVPYEKMDLTPGAKNDHYPRQCIVEDNLIHDIGMVEKQIAGIQIQIAAQINVSHNSIYRSPRAGINIGDGAFGGHVLEYNDVFDTVLETSDHGSFNSWGRDRFWHPDFKTMDTLTQKHRGVILLDALYTTVIRNNRFRCDHGWDIDLDDGSSNYHIYNNLCLRGGIKLREGFFRRVENNLVINSSLHPHLWFPESGDVVQRNVFMQPYFPISVEYWGEKIDFNFFSGRKALDKVRKDGTDVHSVTGELIFANPQRGDYTLLDGSEANIVSFENIPMDRFGVRPVKLKAIAETPLFPDVQQIDDDDDSKIYEWLGAKIRIIKGLGDQSAFGLPDQRGVVIVDMEEESLIAKSGLLKNDVIRDMSENEISSIEEVFASTEQNRWLGRLKLKIFRNQKEEEVLLKLK